VEAIEVGRCGPMISGKCIGCGICFAACPNGAMCATGSIEQAGGLISAAVASTKKSALLRIACRRAEAAADAVLPCLAKLTEALLLAPIKQGISAIELLCPPCSACDWRRSASLIVETVGRAQKVLEMFGIPGDSIGFSYTKIKEADAPQEKPISRRDLLRELGARTLQAAVDKIPVISEQSGEIASDEEYQKNLRERAPYEKRFQLLKSIDGLKSVQVVSMTGAGAPVADLSVTEQCTGCKTCATLCPTGAIRVDENDFSFSLKFTPRLCSNCRLCNDVCRRGALRIKKDVVINRLLENEESILFKSEKGRCRICGLDFIANLNGVCPLCAGRIKKQQKLVRNLTLAEIQ